MSGHNLRKGSFSQGPDVRPDPVTGDWRLLASFSYKTLAGRVVTVPAGFVTDFASIPRIFRSVFESTGGYCRAAVIHDKMYYDAVGSRKIADKIFYQGMKVDGVGELTSTIIYIGVRIGGFIAWRKHIKRQGRF